LVKHARMKVTGLIAAAALAGLVSGGCPDYVAYGSCSNASATECDDGDPCTTDTCGQDKQCVHAAAPDADIAEQKPGDCLRSVCRAGLELDTADPTDVKDDGESCTVDTCTDGKPVSTPVASGTACEDGAKKGGCVKGACVTSCKDKPGACDDGEACTVDSCDTKKDACVFAKLDVIDTPGMGQTSNDCRRHRCVDGKDTNVVDNTDLPKSMGDCYAPACVEGVATTPPLPYGTACSDGGGRICDGGGKCVQCFAASDCTDLPEDGPCQIRTCDSGKCVMAMAKENSPIRAQIPGTCQKIVCDGQGAQKVVPDPSNASNDGNDCTTDSCDGTTTTHAPKPKGAWCGIALTCDGNGQCVGCRNDGECGFGDECHTNTCQTSGGGQGGGSGTSIGVCSVSFSPKGTPKSLQQKGNCLSSVCDGAGNTQTLLDPTNTPTNGGDCTTESCNAAGTPTSTPQPFDAPCKDGHCDGQTSCKACVVATDCPKPAACVIAYCNDQGACATANLKPGIIAPPEFQTAGDCHTIVCDGQGGTRATPTDDLSDDGKECTVDTCENGTPRFTPIPAGTPCPVTKGKTCDGYGACGG
jgi:hypothetical protein